MAPQIIKTLDEFNKLIAEASTLVVVDFFADWCGPCRMIAPKYEALSEEYDGCVIFVKVNVDDAGDIAEKCGISAMPTFQFFKGGEKLKEMQGANETKLKEFVESLK